MPSPDRSLALTRRQDAGLRLAAVSLAVAGTALAVTLLRGSRRAARPHLQRRHAEKASEAGRLEARTTGLRASRRAFGAPQHHARNGNESEAGARAARNLDRAAATLSASVLFDSSVEHYRGMFQNRSMVIPLATSTLTLAASLPGSLGSQAMPGRGAAQAIAIASGLVGVGFHARNILRREGGLSWQNLFYAAPFGAPAALSIAGGLGLAAEHVRGGAAPILGLPAGPALAGFAAFGILGSTAEAGLLHFRGAFQNPAMLIPVTVPPLAVAALAAAASDPGHRGRRELARWALRATAALGVGGVTFHAYGVSRMMGGWYNWTQNLVDGPPLPAPPAFTGLALAGLAALDLMEAQDG